MQSQRIALKFFTSAPSAPYHRPRDPLTFEVSQNKSQKDQVWNLLILWLRWIIIDTSYFIFTSFLQRRSLVFKEVTVRRWKVSFYLSLIISWIPRHGSATALLYLFWIVATLVMVATQTLILIRRNEIIDHFDKHASFWRNNEAKNCKQSKKVTSTKFCYFCVQSEVRLKAQENESQWLGLESQRRPSLRLLFYLIDLYLKVGITQGWGIVL